MAAFACRVRLPHTCTHTYARTQTGWQLLESLGQMALGDAENAMCSWRVREVAAREAATALLTHVQEALSAPCHAGSEAGTGNRASSLSHTEGTDYALEKRMRSHNSKITRRTEPASTSAQEPREAS